VIKIFIFGSINPRTLILKFLIECKMIEFVKFRKSPSMLLLWNKLVVN